LERLWQKLWTGRQHDTLAPKPSAKNYEMNTKANRIRNIEDGWLPHDVANELQSTLQLVQKSKGGGIRVLDIFRQ